jgi:hypothetical protein
VAERLRNRGAWIRAGLAVLAAGAAAFLCLFEQLLYAVGEHEGDYYDFSAYMEYRHALEGWLGIVAAGGYALLAGALGLAAGVAWRRVHPAAGAAVAVAACVAVILPWEVPSRLDRVEYGQDPVLHPVRPGASCFKYSVEGVYPTPPESRTAPTLCLHFQEADRSVHARTIADELNDSGIEPYELPDSVDVEGVTLDRAEWTRR